MKIALVNVYFYPAMAGGAEWYVYNVSRELVRRGHEVHVFTTDVYQGKKIEPSEDAVSGVIVHRVPLWLDLTYRTKIWQGLEKRLLSKNFDVIHTFDYGQYHSYIAGKVGKAAHIPVALTVFDVHSMIPRTFYKRFSMKVFDKYVARFTFRRASGVLVRAPHLINALVGFGVSREKILVTPSGINDEALQKADGEGFLKNYSILSRPVILYLGRLHPSKGLQHLIMAAPAVLAAYPDARFVFVGPDPVGYRSKLISFSKWLGVDKNLVFTGPIYDLQRKLGAYASADVFVLPSGYEGTSQAVFEAMAQARPIVATNRGGIPFQVEHQKEAILINYGDTVALATTILRLLDNKKLANELGLNAKEKVKNFTYSILVNQLEHIYRNKARV